MSGCYSLQCSPTLRTAFDEDAGEVFETEIQLGHHEKSGVSACLGRGVLVTAGKLFVHVETPDEITPLTNVKVQKRDKDVIVSSDEQRPSIWHIPL